MKFQSFLLLLGLAVLPALADSVYRLDQSPSVYQWLEHPDTRDAQVHLAFVEILAVPSERYSFTNGLMLFREQTWKRLFKVRSGVATLKVIESPGIELPHTLSARFEKVVAVARQPIQLTNSMFAQQTDHKIVPGKKFLVLLRHKEQNQWGVEAPGFIDPISLLLNERGSEVKSLFKTELATPASIAAARQEIIAKASSSKPAAAKSLEGK